MSRLRIAFRRWILSESFDDFSDGLTVRVAYFLLGVLFVLWVISSAFLEGRL